MSPAWETIRSTIENLARKISSLAQDIPDLAHNIYDVTKHTLTGVVNFLFAHVTRVTVVVALYLTPSLIFGLLWPNDLLISLLQRGFKLVHWSFNALRWVSGMLLRVFLWLFGFGRRGPRAGISVPHLLVVSSTRADKADMN